MKFLDNPFEHSFGNVNNDNKNSVGNQGATFGDLGSFTEGNPFKNADSKFVRSTIEQSIQHSANLHPE